MHRGPDADAEGGGVPGAAEPGGLAGGDRADEVLEGRAARARLVLRALGVLALVLVAEDHAVDRGLLAREPQVGDAEGLQAPDRVVGGHPLGGVVQGGAEADEAVLDQLVD
ncbi:hypothetical protein C7Y72_16465 [Paraconexibacter algicola]|uniref:Uncharacterized protein n=1 Tax=Paraconexibacter algicola TaxID=2133960 RepID=A0A2T4UFI6_9ACTN|nr:hypothetical protein C7Y72_16465 [Paraconexibacter algicola]